MRASRKAEQLRLRPSVDRSTTHTKVNPRRPRTTITTNQTSSSSSSLYLSKKNRKKKKKRMMITTLRRGVLRTHAPHRRLPFSTSTSLSSSSSSSSSSATAAQKKAQDALGNASAVLMRAGTYARSALGPFGARLSGLLGCPSHSSRFSLSLPVLKIVFLLFAAYQQPIKYNFAVTREILKHVYTAERLQPPTSLGAVLGTYSTLWARARSIGYWRDVVRSGEYARLGVYALEAYGIFKVRFPFLFPPSLF
jgi:F-type H+-transporting ATPase subunit g